MLKVELNSSLTVKIIRKKCFKIWLGAEMQWLGSVFKSTNHAQLNLDLMWVDLN